MALCDGKQRLAMPHLIKCDDGMSLLVTMKGRQPLCLKCGVHGHTRASCNMGATQVTGNNSRAPPATYAQAAGSGRPFTGPMATRVTVSEVPKRAMTVLNKVNEKVVDKNEKVVDKNEKVAEKNQKEVEAPKVLYSKIHKKMTDKGGVETKVKKKVKTVETVNTVLTTAVVEKEPSVGVDKEPSVGEDKEPSESGYSHDSRPVEGEGGCGGRRGGAEGKLPPDLLLLDIINKDLYVRPLEPLEPLDLCELVIWRYTWYIMSIALVAYNLNHNLCVSARPPDQCKKVIL